MEIVLGIHVVEKTRGNCYFIKMADGSGWALIDTGLPRTDKKLIAYAEKTLGLKPSDLKFIIITHCHVDHVGGIAGMKAWCGAKVASHVDDADFIAGKKRVQMPGKRPLRSLLFMLLAPFMKATPVQPDILLKDHDSICGLEVIHTPGHTPGSICLLEKKRGILFVGDLVRFMDGKVLGPPIVMDEVEVKKSLDRISKVDFSIMLSGHGEPLKEDAQVKVRALTASYPKT